MADVEVIEVAGRVHLKLTTEELQLECVPALGGTIVSLRSQLRPDTELLWRPPWGLRHADAVPLPGSLANVSNDTHPGGWLTMFPNGAESAVVDGADWPAYGEARLTWTEWSRTADGIELRGRMLRAPFELTKTITVRGDEVIVEETVTNAGFEHVDAVWGSRLTFGEAMLGPQTRFDSRAALVRPDARQTPSAGYDDLLPWPRSYAAEGLVNLRSMPSPDYGVTRSAYLSDFSTAEASLTNPEIGLRVDLAWSGDEWPFLWYQLESGGVTGYPWWGAANYLALTAATSWPAAGIAEIRRVSATTMRVYPGSSRSAELRIRVHRS